MGNYAKKERFETVLAFEGEETLKKENKSGSGLGLAITKQITQYHKIEITVLSELYVKTEFTLYFKN